MFPHERSLVKELADQPFALIGVNSDPELDKLKDMNAKEQITWRSFWNGPLGTGGPISTRWNVAGWPTLFLIDHEGKIVQKWLGSPEGEVLDKLIDDLVAKAEAAANEGKKGPMAAPVDDFGIQDGGQDAKPAAETVDAFIKAYKEAYDAFVAAYRAAETPEARKTILAEKQPDAAAWCKRAFAAIDLVKGTEDEARGLVFVLRSLRHPDSTKTALARLAADHAKSEAIGDVWSSLMYDESPEADGLVRKLAEESPHASVRGKMTFALVNKLKSGSRRGGLTEEKTKQIEALLDEIKTKYADIEIEYYGKLGDAAARELFEMHNLQIGKPVPDIEGTDVDGVPFKLSDYRGKVVMLDFWGHW